MFNFTYYNPVKIVFGKGTIAEISGLIPKGTKIMVTYGGGSIMKNGVYDQVMKALKGFDVTTFGGIEPNPKYETLMKAVEKARGEKTGFFLAVGGGSVLDGTKFIASAVHFAKGKEWDIVQKNAPLKKAVPLGCIMTLPATGSEMNNTAVISRIETGEKLPMESPFLYPVFSILDPETTFSLPSKQIANGIVDTFIHVTEQYMTYPAGGHLQDRQAEGILLTLVEEGPKALKNPKDYDTRATLMWCATQALNFLISCGVPQDWATHMIGHEITALHGLDHAETLAIILPGVWRYKKKQKAEKLVQYAERVWGITGSDNDAVIEKAIDKTEKFFNSLGIKTKLSGYGIPIESADKIASIIDKRGNKFGEHADIGGKEIREILKICY